MAATEMQVFEFVKEHLKHKQLATKFIEKYNGYKDNDLKALHKRLVRVYVKIKNYRQASLKKSNQESLKKAETSIFPFEPRRFSPVASEEDWASQIGSH